MEIFLNKLEENIHKLQNWYKYDILMTIECFSCSRFRKDWKRTQIRSDIEYLLKSVFAEKFDDMCSDFYIKYENICE